MGGGSLCDPLKMYLGDIYTVSVNLAGLPASAFRVKPMKKDCRIGLQMIAKLF